MKVLWLGDAACASGFARCTHAVCDRLHASGHEVSVLGINYFGDPHPYPYNIYPCRQPLDQGFDNFGLCRLPRLIDRLQPDIVVILTDPWNVPEYISRVKKNSNHSTPIIAWLMVDGTNQSKRDLDGLDGVVVSTRFAHSELGLNNSSPIIPLGVDGSVFCHKDKRSSRLGILGDKVPTDAFIVGAVTTNQYRKRIDLAFESFSRWIKAKNRNAYLLIHIAPTGEQYYDVYSLARYYEVESRTIVFNTTTDCPTFDSDLADIYNCMDVFLSTSQGEGWGLPALEAMACKVPCILPDWGGYDWSKGATYPIDCISRAVNAPRTMAYTIGGVPSVNHIVDLLETSASTDLISTGHRMTIVSRGGGLAKELTWESTGKLFIEFLEARQARLSAA